jgi:hypothetical protein
MLLQGKCLGVNLKVFAQYVLTIDYTQVMINALIKFDIK